MIKSLRDYITESEDRVRQGPVKGLDKLKKSIISDFAKGKSKALIAVYDLYDEDNNVVKKDEKMSFDIFELNIFGSSKMWDWETLFSLVAQGSAVQELQKYLDKEALAYSFRQDSASSIVMKMIDKIFSKVGYKYIPIITQIKQ